MIKIAKLSYILPAIFLFVFFITLNNTFASSIQNRYLLISVDDETGRLFLSTIDGKPEVKGDEKKNLLFYDKPPSSYTLVYLDDDILTFGSDYGRFNPTIADSHSIKLEWIYQYVTITQEIIFVKRKNSGIEDGVLIKYSAKNRDVHPHNIGFRILFDTYLGENSRYHFGLSSGERLRGEKIFDGRNIPDYWISKDVKGVVCLRGVLKGSAVTTPNRVIFANYKALSENLKNYYVRRGRDFDYPPYSKNDSAIALYYDPLVVESGKERSVKTILGLCSKEEYEGEKPLIVVAPAPQEKKTLPMEQKKQKKIVYHIKDYKEFKSEMSNIANLKEEIRSIDDLLKQINTILEKRDSGQEVDVEQLKKIEKMISTNENGD